MSDAPTARPQPQKGFLRTRRWVGDSLANEAALREATMFITAVRPAGLRDALEADLRDCIALAQLAANPCYFGHTFEKVEESPSGIITETGFNCCLKCGAPKPPPAYEESFEDV